MFFYWDDNNTQHLEKHQVEPLEAEYVVRHAKHPYPRGRGPDKLLVRGRTLGGRRLQVVWVRRYAEDIELGLLAPIDRVALLEGEPAVYIIHARDLRAGER
jgi:hypothetical protein